MSMKVEEVIALYLDSLAARVAEDDYSPDSELTVRTDLLRFSKKYGTQTIEECKQQDLTAWLTANPQWKAVTSKRRVVGHVTACFNWALDEELINRAPYRLPRILRGKKAAVRRPATQEEYVSLMRNGTRELRRVLYLLRRTGMRTCELYHLNWDEVNLTGPHPHLCIARHKAFRKTGKPRLIGLDKSTARFLANLKRQYEARCTCNCDTCREFLDPHVFTNCKGTPWNRRTFARHFRRLAESIGLDELATKRVSAYCLRHFFVVNAIESGIATRSIAVQLGHGSTAMIDSVYGSHTRNRVQHLGNVADEVNHKRHKQSPKGNANE